MEQRVPRGEDLDMSTARNETKQARVHIRWMIRRDMLYPDNEEQRQKIESACKTVGVNA